MKFSISLTRPRLRVVAAVCSNFVVVWLVAMLGTRHPLALTANLGAAILSLYLAIKAEELAEKL